MDFIDALRVLVRQWRVLVVAVVLIGLAGGIAIFAVPTKYQAAGQLVLLLPPQSTGASNPTNPYLNLEPGLTIAASLIASKLSTKDSRRQLESAGFTSKYAIGINPGAGPLLDISADDTDGAMAIRTRDEVISRLQDELTRMQLDENSPQRQLIHARTNSAPNVADPLPGSKLRALAAIGGLGLVITLLVAFIRDRRFTLAGVSADKNRALGGKSEREEPPLEGSEAEIAPPARPEGPTVGEPDPAPVKHPDEEADLDPAAEHHPEADSDSTDLDEESESPSLIPPWPPIRSSSNGSSQTRRKRGPVPSSPQPAWWDA